MGHISRQSSVFFAGTIFTTGAGYFFKIYLARVLGAEALGVYTLGMTVVGLAGVVAAVGLPQSAAKFVAAYSGTGQLDRLRGFLWRCLAMLALLGGLVGVGLLFLKRGIASGLYHAPELATYMHFFVAIMFLGGFTTFLGQAMAGYKDVARRTVITNFLGTPLTMCLSVVLLMWGLGLRGYLIAQVAAALIVLALLARATWQLTPRSARGPHAPLPRLEREVVSFSAVLLAVQGLEFLLSQTDRIVLGIYLDARAVGIYSVAAAMTAFVPIVLQSVNQIFSPIIAELHALGDRDLLRRLYQTLTKWILGLTIPLALMVIVFSRPLMAIFGPDFVAGWPVLVIGTAGQLVNCGVGSVGLLLLMSGQQGRTMRVQMFVAPATIALNLGLIPVWGVVGASVASATANVLINFMYLWHVRHTLALMPSGKSYWLLIWPTLATLAVVLVLRTTLKGGHLQIVVMAIALISAYAVFVLSAMVFGLEPDDKLIALNAWGRVRSMFGERTV